MTPSAIPTPFDIIPPPPPLWTPSLQVWLLLLALTFASIVFLVVKNRKVPPPPLAYRDQLLGDIRRCIAHNDCIDLEYVVQLALRTLSFTTGEDFGAESAISLKNRAKNESNPSLAALMEKVGVTKDLLYAPRLQQDEVTIFARSLAVSAEEVLSAAVSEEPSE
jgi:hypothetical protein